MFFEIYLRHRWIRTIFLLFVILLYSNLCLSWAPILIHLFFNGIQFWIMGSILQTFTRQCFTSDRIVKVFLKLVTTHPTFILGWLWIGGCSALIKRNFSSFSGISDGLGKPSLICDKKSRLKILTSILCLPQCPCVLLYLRPKPKGGAEARHWKTSWKRRSPNAKKQRERKKISHNNDKIENE